MSLPGKSPEGVRIGEMEISLADNPVQDGNIIKRVKMSVKGENSSFQTPQHPIDSIDLFGLPPYGDWSIGLDAVDKSITRSFDGEDFTETYSLNIDISEEVKIKIQRNSEDKNEEHSIREINFPNRPKVNSTDIKHSEGRFRSVTEKYTAVENERIKDFKKNMLDKDEEDYFKSVFREERMPDVLILKNAKIRGTTPPFTSSRNPFWKQDKHEDDQVRILEMGYFEYGNTGGFIDESHGRWYKHLKFENFDHERLEIQEQGWESQEIEFENRKKEVLKNYNKYLYKI